MPVLKSKDSLEKLSVNNFIFTNKFVILQAENDEDEGIEIVRYQI